MKGLNPQTTTKSGRQFKLAASLLDADIWYLPRTIGLLQKAQIDFLHIDVMDGHFVPEICGSSQLIRSLKKHCDLPLEVHLMVSNPILHIENTAKAGAQTIIIHYEACKKNLEETFRNIQKYKCRIGLAINPKTTLATVYKNIPPRMVKQINCWLMMGVQPGYGGQELVPEVFSKIKKLRKKMEPSGPFPRVPIQIDGGLRTQNVETLLEAGAEHLIAGSLLMRAQDLKKEALEIKKMLVKKQEII